MTHSYFSLARRGFWGRWYVVRRYWGEYEMEERIVRGPFWRKRTAVALLAAIEAGKCIVDEYGNTGWMIQ